MSPDSRPVDETQVHYIAPGVWGRKIPESELYVKPEQVEKLAEGKSQAFKNFVTRLYKDSYGPKKSWFKQLFG